MAIYNEILAPRYARMLQKLFSMKGSAPVRQLAGEINCAIPLFLGAEARFLEGWFRFGYAVVQAAVAANTSCIRWRNPVGSNIVVVFEKIDISEGAADGNLVLRHGQTSTDLATVQSGLAGTNWDARFGTAIAPTLVISNQATTPSAPAIGGNENSNWVAAIAANFTIAMIGTDIQEIPLLPGDALQLRSGVVNQSLSVGFWWRERLLEESERQ